ncbi:cytochrome P450 [Gloeophyllum trabeum ATCC 11539]|uniref:Cytochrome P450 n=1 Tax=Gloeophyllum trabeum (strain ATCC 11539 / FP-39264 / Madison 617) TaxID=670483 RepID=S7RQA3_GLOTA|nr:cytochrome P450 [Gloeophyllum trabeum ATCC 11539]EPQ55074.1 cytochrome P450 [Gloeophyllum trabeum ATCC 11539]
MSVAYYLGIVALLCLIYVVCYRVFLSPLAKIPGPVITRFTGGWLLYQELTRRRRLYVHELHKRYGPVVRIAPDEVSFATGEAAKQIYSVGGSGFEKTEFYDLFMNFGARNMFSTLTKSEHSERKRRMADRYAKKYVMQSGVLSGIEERARMFVKKVLQECAAQKCVNVYVPLHCYALDGITHHLFHPFGTHAVEDDEDLKMMQELSYHDSLKSRVIQHRYPRLHSLLSNLANPFRATKKPDRASAYVLENCTTAKAAAVADHTVLSKLQARKDTVPILEMASECMDHLVAGIDTTGDGLCFLLWQLSRPESGAIQDKLRAELLRNPATPVDELPYLEAVVKEGLRCYSPIPMSLPRRVPDGGRVLEGYFLPAWTTVSCQAFTLHQLDTEVFPRPGEFIPERWLEQDRREERNKLFFAFASGGRGCIGRNLALMEMKILLKEVYCTYRTTLSPDMTASMEISDQIIASRPKDQVCLLQFQEIA